MAVPGSVSPVGTLPIAPALDPLATAAQRRRAWRVMILTAAVLAMSLVDLHITLLYVRSVGMGEANPLARWVMMHFSPSVLIWWKLLTVALACAIFVTARRTRIAELGAWVACGLLVWLTIRWMIYSDEITVLTPVLHTLSEHESAKWVHNPH